LTRFNVAQKAVANHLKEEKTREKFAMFEEMLKMAAKNTARCFWKQMKNLDMVRTLFLSVPIIKTII
jgi:predicted DNA-binding protein YlxM (UPF0122 family)